MRPWHSLPAEDVLQHFHVSARVGLAKKGVRDARRHFGFNALTKKNQWRTLRLFVRQIESPLVLILIAAGLITFFILRDYPDAIIIGIAVSINTIIGVVQEGRASRAFDALKSTIKRRARVVRESTLQEIDAEELVPGDIIEVDGGMSIEADARIISSHRLRVNEASLSGEWIGQEKNSAAIPVHTSLADRSNMLYQGTFVEVGVARAVVIATAERTVFGEIAKSVEDTMEEPTPFQKHLASLSRLISVLVVIIASLFFIAGLMRGENMQTMFLTSVAIAVSAVPEGLPIAITVILALGTERILKRGGLLKRLKNAETLGSINIILTDKTGTLTEGIMAASHVVPHNDTNEAKIALLMCGTLTSSAFIENPDADLADWRIRGEATDQALLLAGFNAGITKESFEKHHHLVDFYPFDSELMFSAAVYQENEKEDYNVFVSGAPEVILAHSNLTAHTKAICSEECEKLTRRGARTIACAHRRVKKLSPPETLFSKLDFLGFIGLHDPLRADAKEALHAAEDAGIRPVIITGDHRLTAQVIAGELNFDGKDNRIIDGDTFEKGSIDVEQIDIYTRVLPHQKSSIVEAWQAHGAIVAMTGDGVNDAPALKEADIGIALGSGTDVAKEAADLVLLNNSFSTIIAAIEEGRAIVDNIRKAVTFLLATVFTEIVLIGGALLVGLPLPILPGQILWMNLVGEGFFNFAFAFERKEHDAMRQKPVHRDVFFTREMKALIFLVGIVSDLFLFGIFIWFLRHGAPLDTIRTIMFTGLAVDSFFFVFSLRSLRRPLWKINFFSNPYLLFAFGASIALLIPVFAFEPLGRLLHIVPLTMGQVSIIAALGIVDVAFIELVKYYFIARRATD
jgi:Ca2+-transporting ATPase